MNRLQMFAGMVVHFMVQSMGHIQLFHQLQNFKLLNGKQIIDFKLYYYIVLPRTSLCGVMDKVLDCGLKISEFELQSRHYVHFRTNTETPLPR